MFFAASKLVWMVAVPSTFLTLLAALGLLLALRWRRVGLAIAALGGAGLLLAGLGPFGRVLLVELENRFPAYADDGGRVDGVIVLGGAELPVITAARGQPSFQESAERILAMGELARRYPQARLVFAGGGGSLSPQAMQEAEVVRLALPQIGVEESRVEFERASRNTAENARLARALLQPKPGERWLLVTSGYHMPRAVGCFEAAGFPVVPYPVDFRTAGEAGWLRPFDSVAQGLGFFDLAVREWIGLAAYYLTGRIASPFPAPAG
ncbi:YdcF family protein [Starkeya koreensis]|uniref:YdcF family protein n=1 Tax=Ancylobacter koreensis TaxID=266121 RepID=A0ABT0DRV5_9HYPH|nr:YdcF family protein [Ancylobacter koreensis]MCK0210007.1 YdcF family protein [Ancylobacter koreensis]